MFDEFKAQHGGLGPFQSLLNNATHGALVDRIRVKTVAGQMDDTLSRIQNDPAVSDDFKDHAAEVLKHGAAPLGMVLKNISALNAERDSQHTIGDTFRPVLEGAQSLYDNASSPADKQVLSSLLANAQAAHSLALNPATRQDGMKLFGDVAKGVTDFTVKNKENEVAQQTRDEQAARDLIPRQLAAYQNSRETWQKDSTPFFATQDSWKSVQTLAALKHPNADTDQNLLRGVAQILNPGTATRPGENPGDAFYSAFDSIPGLGAVIKSAVTNNSGLTSEDRATVIYLAAQRVKEQNSEQMDRNTRALAEGKAEGLPDPYLNLLTTAPISLGAWSNSEEPRPAAPPPTPKPGTVPTKGGEPDSPATQAGTSVKDAAVEFYNNAVDAADAALGGPGAAIVRAAQEDSKRRSEAAKRTDEYNQQLSTTSPVESGGGF